MKCSKCGLEFRTNANFCEGCGIHLLPICSACGAQLSETAKFCPQCGHPAEWVSKSSSSAAPHLGVPEAYTPSYLAEKILTSKSALEGERKQVTVLFADLKSSMELFADRDPEEARKILDPVIERMMEAVHRYEGTVNHVLGDGIVALFGAPLAHEDHAVRACYAAIRMQETVTQYAETVRRSAGIPIQIRVGLNSGEVVVRSIGNDLRMDYTVVGQTTNLAARMEQMAVPGSTFISADTLALAEGYIEVDPLGPLKVKGIKHPLQIFELTGAATVRSRLHVAVARGLTHFVGRDDELDQLRQALDRAGAGHGQVVAVVGDPGVGKSRLYWEFIRSRLTQGWSVIESSSVSYGKATAFLPIIALLRTYFQIEGGDDSGKIREKLTVKLLSLERALEPILSALLWLLDAPIEEPEWQDLEPSQRRARALEAVKRLLVRESQTQPLLLLFEDLHWIDSDTQALLDSLVDSLPRAQLLLLVNYRPEYQHDWSNKSYYRQISIEPLPPENAEELLESLLGNDVALLPLKRLLIERTEGNPFFLEESIRTLVETGALIGERGGYCLVNAPQSLQIPGTAQAVLAARIDRLAAEDKRLLQAASVIGKEVPFTLLRAIAELPEESLRGGLSRLQATEFLYEVLLFPDLEYTFKHAMTHEVAYGGMLHERRRALHRQIMETIERLYPDQPEYVDQLARHALRGEAWEKAVNYLCQAGSKAAARSALREAVKYFEQALDALARLPESRETIQRAIDIRLDLQAVLYPLAGIEKTLDHLHQAESLAETSGDKLRLGRVSAHMTYCYYWMGNLQQAVAAGERARSIAVALEDLGMQVSANVRLGQTYFAAGEFRRAAELFEWNIANLEGDLENQAFGLPLLPSGLSRDRLGWCLATLGEFDAARETVERGVLMAEAAQHPFTLAKLCLSAGWVSKLQGRPTEALSWIERARDLSRDENIPILTAMVAWRLGEAYALAGRIEDSVGHLEQASEQLAAMKHTGFHPQAVTALTAAYLSSGRIEEARQSVQLVLSSSRRYGQPGFEAEALRVLGDIETCQMPRDEPAAAAAFGQALTLANQRGMCPLAAHCHLGLGEHYRRKGDQSRDKEHMATASTMYREMEMTFWLERAES